MDRTVTIGILFTTLFPLFLGGDLERWVQGVVFCCMGVIFLASPPQHPMRRGVGWIAAALFAVSLTAFLPAAWFGTPEWRRFVVEDLMLDLPATRSPQPWLSLDGILLLGAGLLWIYYLSGRPWLREDRPFIMRVLGASLLLFTAASFAGFILEWNPPLWEGQKYFGSIANRNQMAILLSFTALVCIGCAYYDFHGRHKLRAVLWAASLPFIFAALVINGSRAGVFLFFGGLGAWIIIVSLQKRSVGILGGAGSVLLILTASFFLYGGRTLERLKVQEEDLTTTIKGEARFEIFRETLELITVSPLFGTGLGNFGPLYALHRDLENSSLLNRVAQPDNDWLWLAVETGLAGSLLAVSLIILISLRAFPLSGSQRHDGRSANLRITALVCAALFCVDGLVSIPGHRIAVVLPGILLFALALHANRRRRTFFLLKPLYRVAGLALILIGLTWIGATVTKLPFPGMVGIESLSQKAFQAEQDENFDEAIDFINQAIRLQPLRYRHYFKRADYAANGGRPLDEVVPDFEIARQLEPSHPAIPLGEAEFWLGLRPVFAIPALEDAMRRLPSVAAHYFHSMAVRSGIDPRFRRALGELAFTDPELNLQYLAVASPKEIAIQLERIVAEDPALEKWNDAQRKRLFSFWYRMGDQDALVAELLSRPDWLSAGWRELCRYYSSKKDFEAALEVAKTNIPIPELPRLFDGRSAEELRTSFVSNPTDVSIGIRLYLAESLDKNLEGAVLALEKTAELPDCPDYAFYLLAEAREKLALFEGAWESLEIYMRKKPPL